MGYAERNNSKSLKNGAKYPARGNKVEARPTKKGLLAGELLAFSGVLGAQVRRRRGRG